MGQDHVVWWQFQGTTTRRAQVQVLFCLDLCPYTSALQPHEVQQSEELPANSYRWRSECMSGSTARGRTARMGTAASAQGLSVCFEVRPCGIRRGPGRRGP